MQSHEDWDDDFAPRERTCDQAAMRILAGWVARHDGRDPQTGIMVERDFVVLAPHN